MVSLQLYTYSAFHQDFPLLKSLYNSHVLRRQSMQMGTIMVFEAAELENDVRNVIECS